ncbi:DUF4166 domain-containing protein [Peribacillus frigoritolerans]|uniref:DUF4166 domain-containing protein n=1 Tax=Peribacillus frigoritolerans TaxID=450367 RepID=UPI00105981FE|nr:DUF4166 domain-containing protein [Peribacillus frigoritolerans]TDL80572.1 DUF4166 domain-containing protein [Peribacillus frigoritolerans]
MSIYRSVLGDQFQRLHPKLQKRYEFPFTAKGVMKTINGGPKWLYPFFLAGVRFKLLFPEDGQEIPFVIRNTPRTGADGEEQVHWERIFYFKKKKRYFNALMSLDSKRNLIKDYLGEPKLFYSDLSFHVNDRGQLKIESRSQRLVLGKLEIPMPELFQGLAFVTESYDQDRDVFLIEVKVVNRVIGTVFSYEGAFTADEI